MESYDPGQTILLRNSKCGCRICTVSTSNEKKRGCAKQDMDSAEPLPSEINFCSKCKSVMV